MGKSSLLNAVQPGLGLAVREISEAFQKGRHTTTVRQLFPLEGGGYVADMPGMRSLALWDTEPEELDGYFPELAPLVEKCQFNDCNTRANRAVPSGPPWKRAPSIRSGMTPILKVAGGR